MTIRCHDYAAHALGLSWELLDLANRLTEECAHDDCLLLAGVLRDAAWRIREAGLDAYRAISDKAPEESRR